MSLTTAVSDDDEIDENMQNSAYRAKQSATAASFNCTGAVRKAGFLSVKKWILRKKHQVRHYYKCNVFRKSYIIKSASAFFKISLPCHISLCEGRTSKKTWMERLLGMLERHNIAFLSM